MKCVGHLKLIPKPSVFLWILLKSPKTLTTKYFNRPEINKLNLFKCLFDTIFLYIPLLAVC